MGTARISSKSPSSARKASLLPPTPAAGGPASRNPNAVQGKGSLLESQRDANAPVDEEEQAPAREARALDDTVVRGPGDDDDTQVRGNDEPEPPLERLGGDTGIADATKLNLRDGPDLEAKVIKELPKGTVMTRHARKGKWLQVKAWSGFKGLEGWIHSNYWLSQPDLTPDEDKGGGAPDPYVYEQVVGQPFHGKPTAKDAAQGAIGDCYLIAAMGALAAQPAGQAELMKMIQPNGPAQSYTVTFKEEQWNGTYKKVPVKVDMWLPAKDGKLKFALMGKQIGDLEKVPLWPVIVEKAYAKWKGGYDALDKGGSPGNAMSEIGGVDVRNKYVSSFRTDEDLLEAVKGAVDKGQAIVAATKSKKTRVFDTLRGGGAGPYAYQETNKADPGSVSIVDKEDHAPWVYEDGKGKLQSDAVGDKKEKAAGTVDYGTKTYKVKVDVTYPEGHSPDKAGDLQLEYDAMYWLSDSPKICANHAYIVERATDNGIVLANPWGSYHPGEVDIKTFRECYYSFAGAELIKQVESGDA